MTGTTDVRSTILRLSLALAAGAALACAGGDSQAPEVQDIRGTYEGLWDMSMQTLDGSSRQGAECRGTVTVSSQTDTSFTGSFRVDSAGEATGDLSCEVVEGQVVEGRHGNSGLANFHLESGDGGAAAALSGCEGGAMWQGDFTLTPDRPEEGRLDAGSRFTLRCENQDGSTRSWDTEIQFRGTEP
ncbi:MAG: hypothetical protein Q8W44_10850 [Candidatus Palauibacterales bacterium]|nr:hypothetical protein [Candidatus Palauibacterales bacterium]